MNRERRQDNRKRQARGELRIAQILDAAAECFGEVGFASTSTNAIAATAGISPGSLYQFFANKDDIARALAKRYIRLLEAAHGEAFADEVAKLPLSDMLDRIVDPIVAFNLAHPGFQALLADPGVPSQVSEAKKPLHAVMLTRIDAIFGVRAPELAPDKRRRGAEVAVGIFAALLRMVLAAGPAERPALVAELKRAVGGYLGPLVGEGAV
ncbi:TetR/AcrR family transcriptional regulator [Phytomonospora endophytica]|uniref:AcrR family transcriptional regulator n=1 Tax=Phytomonospora endophytica TaxID=714109 RepID=A0A841FQR0_9ACTN|nr:TetR/AcrR family transcriptional regulator [Phytomonospora endophytica]MBB6038406.1 AcrR family transcriptional regulator [Phytomonospora endophytica]GIG64337.1 TetR family transcriptional regulator [Phytomonospora endophytica]